MQWSPGDKIFCKSEKTKDKRIKARTLQNTLRHEYQICLFQYHSKIFFTQEKSTDTLYLTVLLCKQAQLCPEICCPGGIVGHFFNPGWARKQGQETSYRKQ